eukprot:CAMPEP_0118926020 /NCGR_PEP_ID=MMETSP1169-20130426/3811_1 /TAXON_ID=36882 /ORGANISM="Pyramimonas obovata, Strain CCMP722" /LENGTH=218 /DNA_ID=CAMNT_0006867479 /DNA_START=361 /DNA_END=1017 /DNA_ORIENTATION=-
MSSAGAAGVPPGKPPGHPLGAQLDELLSEGKKGWKQLSRNMSKSAKEMKNFTMTVDTKVDFITPALESAKSTSNTIWSKVPTPAQEHLVKAAPYVGVGFGTFVATRLVTLNNAKLREAKLLEELALLKQARDSLATDLKSSKARENALEMERAEVLQKLIEARAESAKPNPQMLSMSQYVTEATKAAAEAATAVAFATDKCTRTPKASVPPPPVKKPF